MSAHNYSIVAKLSCSTISMIWNMIATKKQCFVANYSCSTQNISHTCFGVKQMLPLIERFKISIMFILFCLFCKQTSAQAWYEAGYILYIRDCGGGKENKFEEQCSIDKTYDYPKNTQCRDDEGGGERKSRNKLFRTMRPYVHIVCNSYHY